MSYRQETFFWFWRAISCTRRATGSPDFLQVIMTLVLQSLLQKYITGPQHSGFGFFFGMNVQSFTINKVYDYELIKKNNRYIKKKIIKSSLFYSHNNSINAFILWNWLFIEKSWAIQLLYTYLVISNIIPIVISKRRNYFSRNMLDWFGNWDSSEVPIPKLFESKTAQYCNNYPITWEFLKLDIFVAHCTLKSIAE